MRYPQNAVWDFHDEQSGLATNQSNYTDNNPGAPEGAQVAFLQYAGFITQTVSLSAGNYTLSFQAAQIGVQGNSQEVRVSLRATTALGPATNRYFVWDGDTMVEERDASNSVTKRFFADGEKRIGGSDAGNYYYSRDHLGSIREVTDSTGALKAQYDYDEWGNSFVVSGNMNVDFGYTGHYFHQPSGLNFTLNRIYNPPLARWMTRDPLQNAEMSQGANLYAYVGNDPINAIDPLGLDAFVYNTGGLFGHTAFVITNPSGGVTIFHQYAASHMAGSNLLYQIEGLISDRSVVWDQQAVSITQWLADEHRAGNDFVQEAAFPGSILTDDLINAQLSQLEQNNDIPYSFFGGENCHNFAYDWLINYARTEALVRSIR